MGVLRVWTAVLLVVAGNAGGVSAGTIWQSDAVGLPETDIRSIVPMGRAEGLLAATPRHLYRYLPKTQSWKRVLGVRAPDEVVEVAAEPGGSKTIWLATRRTIRRSTDSGRSWKTVFRRDSESGFQIRTIRPDADGLLAGTTDGLYRLLSSDLSWTLLDGSPKTAVDSIVLAETHWIIATTRGIYRATRHFESWELIHADLRREPSADSDALGQFSIEEIASTPGFSNSVVWRGDGRIFLGRPDGIFEAAPQRHSIERLPETDGFNIRRLTADERFVYLATDRGVYRLEPSTKSVENISQGLESLDVATVAADPQEGIVYAGTRKGIFRLPAPEALPPSIHFEAGRTESGFVPALPSNEPTVLEIQRAAVHYAEVSPDKIRAWRDAAARKAWLPTVSLDTDFGRNQNVDLDRGGTNDPDRFIIGPEEKKVDWSVGVSWDLGDLIWNDDQTSIDVRSRLMVELRNDILNDVTHLYFERRRVQMELAALPPDVPKLRVEKELKLQELTAQIDALTGSYLSRRLILAGEPS